MEVAEVGARGVKKVRRALPRHECLLLLFFVRCLPFV